MTLKTQKRLAASILKCGESRVWIDPAAVEEVSGAMTHGDVRKYIGLGFIKAKQVVGVSRGRARKYREQIRKGNRRGHGRRRGAKHARLSKKEQWMTRIRSQRRMLRELRAEKKIPSEKYRLLYNMLKAGIFKDKAHFLTYLKEQKLLLAKIKPLERRK